MLFCFAAYNSLARCKCAGVNVSVAFFLPPFLPHVRFLDQPGSFHLSELSQTLPLQPQDETAISLWAYWCRYSLSGFVTLSLALPVFQEFRAFSRLCYIHASSRLFDGLLLV